VVPGFTSGAADLHAGPASGADAYLFEVGTAGGLSDIATLNSTGPSIRVANLPLKGIFFARARAKRGAEVGPASAEITIRTFDLRDAIDAAYFSNGPLVSRTQTPCSGRLGVNCQEIQWREFAGVTVTLQLSSDLDPAARSLLVVESGRLSAAGGRFRLQTADAGGVGAWGSVVQTANTIFVATGSIPTSGGAVPCGWPGPCNGGAFPGAPPFDRWLWKWSIWIPGTGASAYLRGALGYGAMHMANIDSLAIGGASQSIIATGPEVLPCGTGQPECLPDHLTPLDLAVWLTVQKSGLPSGSVRRDFQAAGLVNPL